MKSLTQQLKDSKDGLYHLIKIGPYMGIKLITKLVIKFTKSTFFHLLSLLITIFMQIGLITLFFFTCLFVMIIGFYQSIKEWFIKK